MDREAPVRFGYGLGVERFKWFQFPAPVRFLCKKGFSICVSVQFNRKGRFRVRLLETPEGPKLEKKQSRLNA